MRKCSILLASALAVALILSSCGKKEGETGKGREATGKEAKTDGRLTQVSKEAMDVASLDDEYPELRRVVESAGYVVKAYTNFPAEEAGKKGRMLIYTDKGAKQSGGVVYVRKTGSAVAPSWHWYFADMVPDSVVQTELNQDGLWDVRIVSTRGKVQTYIQEQSFTLAGKDRSDWIAMNGTSSPPVSDNFAMWKCFDGDSTTGWKSASPGAFVEFDVPFGVRDGILSICPLPSDPPRECTVYADGKQIGKVEIRPVAALQMMTLPDAVKGAKRIRLEFTPAQGDTVAVAEIGLK